MSYISSLFYPRSFGTTFVPLSCPSMYLVPPPLLATSPRPMLPFLHLHLPISSQSRRLPKLCSIRNFLLLLLPLQNRPPNLNKRPSKSKNWIIFRYRYRACVSCFERCFLRGGLAEIVVVVWTTLLIALAGRRSGRGEWEQGREAKETRWRY